MGVAPQFLDSVLDAAQGVRRNVVVDLRDCTFIDSTGLAALAKAHRLLDAERSHLVVTNAPPTITRVIELTGLDDYLDIRLG